MVIFLNIANIKSYMHTYVHVLHLLDNSRLASQHLVYTYCFLLLVTYLLDITLCHLITMTICRRVIAYRLDGWYSTSDRSGNFLFRHIQPASGATKNYQKVWAGFLLKGKKDGTRAWAHMFYLVFKLRIRVVVPSFRHIWPGSELSTGPYLHLPYIFS